MLSRLGLGVLWGWLTDCFRVGWFRVYERVVKLFGVGLGVDLGLVWANFRLVYVGLGFVQN